MTPTALRLVSKLSIALSLVVAIITVTLTARAQSTALSQKSSEAGELMSKALSNGYVRVIVSYEPPVPASELKADNASALADLKSRNSIMQDAIISSHFGAAPTGRNAATGQSFDRALARFDYTPNFAVNATAGELEALASDPRVTHIQYDRPVPALLFDSVPLIGMNAAFVSGADGNGQIVAVLDTGVQSNHEMLAGKVVAEACFSNAAGGGGGVSLCPNGSTSQTGSGSANPVIPACINGTTNLCEHGTHVAGEAAGNLAGSITGVAKNARIFAIQIFTRFNTSGSCGGTAPCVLSFTSDQLLALNHVLANQTIGGNKVASVNMSLGGGSSTGTCDSNSLKSAIDNLRAAGILTAIAAGNDGFTNAVSSPGCISTATTVSSVTKAGNVISFFSNMSNVVDLLGPGGGTSGGCFFGPGTGNILGPVPDTVGSTNLYNCFQGTSMATPHVAGAIAAIKSFCTTSVTATQVEDALKNTGLAVTDTRPGGSITKPRIRVDQAVSSLAACRPLGTLICKPRAPRLVDFNGDKRADLLLRRTDGLLELVFMNGLSVAGATILGSVGNEFTLQAAGDYNGDGKADMLFRRTDGLLAMYLMNGSQVIGAQFLGNVGPEWEKAAIGDFNGDGRADLLLRRTDGLIAIYLLNGFSIIDAKIIGQIGTEFSIVGVGDFDGDGKDDLLLRRTDGLLAMYLMNGFSVKAAGIIGQLGNEFEIQSVGDFNGDGRADMLAHRTSDGLVVIYLVNGLSITGAQSIGQIGNEWITVGTGDLNGDGRADIVARRGDGRLIGYLINGFNILSTAAIGDVGTEFESCHSVAIR